MRISLLPNAVTMPNLLESANYGKRIGPPILVEVNYELSITALIAIVCLFCRLAIALLSMCLREAILMEQYCMC